MKELTKRGARTESLSLRIDPKTKFVLDFMVRVTGIRITDLIERAIKDYAEKTTVGGGDFDHPRTWLHYWSTEEGVRTLKLISDADVRTSFEEDELLAFVDQHEEFFFDRVHGGSRKPNTVFVQVLWPKIEEFIEHWRENKAVHRWATGEMMLKTIKAAGMKGPDWPRTANASAKVEQPAPVRKPAVASSKRDDTDDEIPF